MFLTDNPVTWGFSFSALSISRLATRSFRRVDFLVDKFMPRFIVSATTLAGRTFTEHVDAASGAEAISAVRARGFADAALQSAGVDSPPAETAEAEPSRVKDLAVIQTWGRLRKWAYWWGRLSLEAWLLCSVAVGLVSLRRYLQTPWNLTDALLLAALTWPILVAGRIVFWPARNAYHRLLEAVAWNRWEEVLELTPQLNGKAPPCTLAFYEAQALTGLGRGAESLRRVAPYAGGQELSESQYWGLLAGVYAVSGDFDKVIDCRQTALAHAPRDPVHLSALAGSVIRFRGDPCAARDLLDQIDRNSVPELILPFLQTTEGLIALEEEKPQAALVSLERALHGMQSGKANPAAAAQLDKIHAYLALAYSALGDKKRARLHFRRASARLRCATFADIRARCQQARGQNAQ
jgi:tetratricopeptide (TPR) repeat protein